MKTRRASLPEYLVLTAVIVWCGMLLLVPALSSVDHRPAGVGQSLYQVYGHICHQYDSRSLYCCGEKLPVCARCSGIYFGFLLGSIGVVMLRPRWNGRVRIAWSIVLSPMVLDVLLNTIGVRESTILTRVLTGLFFGAGASVILVPLLIQGITEILAKSFFMKGILRESKT